MPAKYSHVKKRSAAGLLKPAVSTTSNLIKESYDPNNPNAHQGHQYHHHIQLNTNHFPILGVQPNSVLPNIDRNLSQAMTAVAHLERAIARILLLRFEWDIARLYSTRLHTVSLTHIPILVAKLAEQGGAGWPAMNADSEEIKDFFRSIIGMDMREAGERVATKSVLWSYTALRRFALANNVPVCPQRGLHSLRLLPYYASLKEHLDTLEERPSPVFEKPAFFGGLDEGYRALEEACIAMGMDLGIEAGQKYDPFIPDFDSTGTSGSGSGSASGATSFAVSSSSASSISGPFETRLKLRLGYTRLVQTLWRVAREFDVRGYGQVLREKLTIKWCECGCSTDHLGEVCERTVREEEEDREREGIGIWGGGELTSAAYAPIMEESPEQAKAKDGKISPEPKGQKGKNGKKKVNPGVTPEERARIYARLKVIKEKEWDGRGSGVYGWETEREEDIWEVELDFGAGKSGRRNKKKTDDQEPPPPPRPLVNFPRSSKSHKEKKSKTTSKTAGGSVSLEEVPDADKFDTQPSEGGDAPGQNIENYAEEEAQMTIGEMMEWRFLKAEREKELGNVAFRQGDYDNAVKHYEHAYDMEPEMPHYQLNLAAAYLKLNNWMEAEKACTKALSQHRSSKGLFRRAKALKMLEKTQDAIKDLRALIRLQPHNTDAMIELLSLLHPPPSDHPPDSIDALDNPWDVNLRAESDREVTALYEKLGITRPKRQKPLPFPKTKADDIKLKLVAIPPDSGAEARRYVLDDHRHYPVGGSSSGAGGAGEGGEGESAGGKAAKLKSGKVRGKEKNAGDGSSGIIRGTAADYGVVLFAWDRYAIRKVE